jgi:hypothetical protein
MTQGIPEASFKESKLIAAFVYPSLFVDLRRSSRGTQGIKKEKKQSKL